MTKITESLCFPIMLFEGVKKARPIDIRAGNRATFSRDKDFLVVEDWVNDQQLVIPKNPTQEAS